MMRSFDSDRRYAARALRRAPSYSATVIGVTALSIALATTAFAVVDGVLFRPLPYPDSHEIFAINGTFDDDPGEPDRVVGMVSPREVNAWQPMVPDTPLTLLGYTSVRLEDGTFVRAATVDAGFLDVFGVRTLMGGLEASDFTTRGPDRPILISYGLWQRYFGGHADVIGRRIPVPVRPGATGRRSYRVAGVLAREGFVPPMPGAVESWIHRASRIDVVMPSADDPDFGERSGVAFTRVPPARADSAETMLTAAARAYRATAPPPGPMRTAAQRRSFALYDAVSLVPVASLVTARQGPVLAIVFATAAG